MFSSVLLVVSIPPIFIMPPLGIILFIISYYMIKKESREELKERNFESDKNHYYNNRREDPTGNLLIKCLERLNSNKFNDNTNWLELHNTWLKSEVDGIEYIYKNDTSHAGNPKVKYSAESPLLNTPEKYIRICEYIKKAPIKEFIEDWHENDRIYDEKEKNFTNLMQSIDKSDAKQLEEIKFRVIAMHQDNVSRKEIIRIIKEENESIRIYKINNLWKIKLARVSIEFKI